MNVKQLAEALGLKNDASESEVLTAAASVVRTGITSKKDADDLRTALTAAGLKLDAGKILKADGSALAGDKGPDPNETPREKALREELAQTRLETAKLQLGQVKGKVEALIAAGKVPPALAETVTKLLSAAGNVHAMSLSTDGSKIQKDAMDVAATVETLLSQLPAISEGNLLQLGGKTKTKEEEEKEKKDAEQLDAIIKRNNPNASMTTK